MFYDFCVDIFYERTMIGLEISHVDSPFWRTKNDTVDWDEWRDTQENYLIWS